MLDGSDGAIHEDGIADGLCVGGGLVVVVEDSAAVLVDDLDLVPSRAQALGGVDYPGAHAEHGMEQGDLGHRSLLTSGDVRPQWRERTRARAARPHRLHDRIAAVAVRAPLMPGDGPSRRLTSSLRASTVACA